MLYLESKGRSKKTLFHHRKHLAILAKHANLDNPQEVSLAIARLTKKNGLPASNTYKIKLCDCYVNYTNFYQIYWERPEYYPEEHAIQPPSPARCDLLIASAKGDLSLRIDISIQTGLRPCEIQGEKGLVANDIHPYEKTITARNTKKCNQRPALKISEELAIKLQTYILKHNMQPNELLFKGDSARYGEHFRRFRNRLADKLKEPAIKSIRLYDLRHAYVTNLLRKTQNAEKVRIMVGHKHLDTTQKYLHLLNIDSNEWDVEFAFSKEEAKKLLKADFTYQLTTPDGTMIFRKPK